MEWVTRFPSASPAAPSRRDGWFRPVVVLLVGVGLTVVVAGYIRWLAADHDRLLFERRSDEATDAIVSRMETCRGALQATAGLFDASERVSAEEFRAFVHALDLPAHLPGVKTVGFCAHVDPATGGPVGARIATEGLRLLEVWPEVEDGPSEPCVAVFVAPNAENESATYGFDLASDAARREAMERARDGGRATASRRTQLVERRGELQREGFVVVQPVYRPGVRVGTPEERRRAIEGFVFVSLFGREALEGALPPASRQAVGFRLYLGEDADPSDLVFASTPNAEPHLGLAGRRVLDVANSRWTVDLWALPGFSEESFAKQWLLALASGLVFSVFLSLAFLRERRARNVSLGLQKSLETSLREWAQSQTMLREIAESIDAVFWVTEHGPKPFIYVSPAFERIWGRPRAALLQDPSLWTQAVHQEDRARVQAAAAEKEAAGTYDELYRIVRPDGAVRWIRDRAFPARMGPSSSGRVYGVAEDVTSLREALDSVRRTEEQLRQAQKMEAVGRLAGGVAHDFNNLLTAILGYADMALELIPRESPVRPMLEQVQRAGESASGLTRQLLAFSRRQILQTEVLDLNAVIADLLKMAKRLVGEDVQIETVLDAGLDAVRADPGQVEQILMNLIVNARDAMPTGGTLLIETKTVDLDESYTSSRPDVRPGRYAMMAVTDSGVGMTDDVKRHLFEPFFTTKGPGKGTGLGLATAYGIAKQSEGHIAAYSEVGRGTTFRVYLPVVAHAAGKRARPEPLPVPRGSDGILLVEDDEQVRTLASTVLSNLGYRVTVAPTPAEALRALRDTTRAPDLLLTDVVMPGMSGRELWDQLRAQIPRLRVLFMSGYTDDAILRYGVLEEGVPFLQKPFVPSELARKVRAVLDASPVRERPGS